MSNIKNAAVMALRGAGIVFLILILYLAVHYISSPHGSVQPMDIVFVPTENDADCTLLMNSGKTVMIDTGESGDYNTIAGLLEKYKINRIDCLILTHPDKDHIGNALELLKNYDVSMVIEPYYDLDNDRNTELNQWIEASGISCMVPTRERNLVFGDMQLKVYPPEQFYYDNDNNYSLAVSVEHGEKKLFFAGDAVRKRTEELLKLPVRDVDLYKMSYHGREYSGTQQLLEQLNPEYVVVTAKAADQEVEAALNGRKVYYTVGRGAAFVCDGIQIWEED